MVNKIITKTLANKLKNILPSMISYSQSVFAPDCLILDNVIIAFKLMHLMKKHNNVKRERETETERGWN